MFPNLIDLLGGRPPPERERQAFVADVHVDRRERRSPKVERLIMICWILIAVKHVAIIWAVHRYNMPFHQLWVNFPTWLIGLVATGIYYGRTRRR